MATKLVNKSYLSAKPISPTCHGNKILNKNGQVNVHCKRIVKKSKYIDLSISPELFQKDDQENREWKYYHSEGKVSDGKHKLKAVGPSGKEKEVWWASGNLRPKESRHKLMWLPLIGNYRGLPFFKSLMHHSELYVKQTHGKQNNLLLVMHLPRKKIYQHAPSPSQLMKTFLWYVFKEI